MWYIKVYPLLSAILAIIFGILSFIILIGESTLYININISIFGINSYGYFFLQV